MNKPAYFWPILSFAALIAIWQVAALIAASPTLPGPSETFHAMREEIEFGYFSHLLATLARVAAAFLIAMAIGSAIGVWLGMNAAADRFFGGWVILFLNLPALVTIILCYVWFGLTEAAAVTAVAVNKIRMSPQQCAKGRRLCPPIWQRWRRSIASAGLQRCAMLFCRNSPRSSQPPPAMASRWSGKSFWWLSCWVGRTALASRSTNISSCSMSLRFSPTP